MVSKLTSETKTCSLWQHFCAQKSQTHARTSPPPGPQPRAQAPFEQSCQTEVTPVRIPGVSPTRLLFV